MAHAIVKECSTSPDWLAVIAADVILQDRAATCKKAGLTRQAVLVAAQA